MMAHLADDGRDGQALTLAEGLRRLADGELSSAGWIQALLARIDRQEPALQAWAAVDRAGALAAAKAQDGRRAAGEEPGPLGGAPLGIKDIIAVEGLQCEAGSPLRRGHIAAADASAVARLRAAGAIVLGKTVTTEFATNAPALTRNPWDPTRTPGASSCGSAAAVAAGMVPAALGTQTGGSILRPAAYCGVVGLKPTYGLVSRAGVVPLAWSVDHVGVLARTVRDTALVLDAMAGRCPHDETTIAVEPFDLALATTPERPKRVAFLKGDFLPRCTDAVAARTGAAIGAMRRAGVAVEEERLRFDLDDLHAAHRIIVRAEAAAYHHRAYLEAPDRYGPDIGNNVASGLMIPAVHYLQTCRLRARFTRAMDELFQSYDLAVFPATLDTAPPADVSTGDPLFCEPCSHTGHPAITLPLGRGDQGLPIGIQLGAARLDDAGLLARACWCEAELGWRAELAEFPDDAGEGNE